MKSKKEMTLGRAAVIFMVAAIIFFGIAYLITSWYAMSFTVWGNQGRAFFAITLLIFGCIVAYVYRIVTSKALNNEMDRVMAEMDKDKEDKAIIDTII